MSRDNRDNRDRGGDMSAPLVALDGYLRTIRWSRSDLARAIGTTPGFVNLVVSGTKPPSKKFIRDVPLVLAPVLGADADDLRRLFFGPAIEHEHEPSTLTRRLAALSQEGATHG